MRVQIRCQHSSGFELRIACESLDQAEGLIATLVQKGYRPVSATHEWPKGPDGSPLCLKHNAVMSPRSKQSDSWFSHRILTKSGEERYCRGYRYGPEATDGFLID
jgi:hypothetical protein